MKYRSKPQEVEAVQWTGDAASMHQVLAFCPVASYNGTEKVMRMLAGKDGAQEWVPVPVGHWIVRSVGDMSDHWPVDPDYFANKYEAVE